MEARKLGVRRRTSAKRKLTLARTQERTTHEISELLFRGMFIVGLLTPAASPVFASTIATFDGPAARFTVATGINDRGQIVGTAEDGFLHSFLLDRGTFTAIDVPGFPSLQVIGINNRG